MESPRKKEHKKKKKSHSKEQDRELTRGNPDIAYELMTSPSKKIKRETIQDQENSTNTASSAKKSKSLNLNASSLDDSVAALETEVPASDWDALLQKQKSLMKYVPWLS